MARTSKRVHAPGDANAPAQKSRHYRAGIYARLSSDQDVKKNESVESQIGIAEKYVEEWNKSNRDKIEVADRYVDLGKTGTNFERDAFRRLMQDIRLGDINCVIVKDLSRFGRNYLEAGNYIEKIFPFLGVRFIAVSDGYDTGTGGGTAGQIVSEIKNLVNDMYAKDFSAKARLSLKQRREEGSYVGGPPPYGYEAYQKGRIRTLIPDKNTEGLVRLIFEKFVETESYQAVADELNKRRVNPPAVYKKTKEVYCPQEKEYKGWDKNAVARILKSETYLGVLVQGRTSITAGKEENRIHRPEEEWVRKENTHEPLVDTGLYEQAARVRRKIRERIKGYEHPAKECPIGENIFNRVLFCGVCGRKMTRKGHVKRCADGRKKRQDGYFCMDSTGTGTERCPDSNRISEAELKSVLSVLLQKEFETRLKKRRDYVEQGRMLIRQRSRELEQGLRQTVKSLSVLAEEESGKYIEYRMGKLAEEEYATYRVWKQERLLELERQKRQYEEDGEHLERKGEAYLKAVRALVKLKNGEELTKELVEALIESIRVYPGKRVEVTFAYHDFPEGGGC